MELVGGYIVDLQKDQTFEGFLLVRSAEVKVAQSGSKYVDLVLGDRTGDISAKWWDGKELPARANEIVKVRATVNEFMNKLQLRVERIRLSTEQDDVHIDELVPVAPLPAEEMWAEVEQATQSIAHEGIKNVVLHLYEKYKDVIMLAPAASHFHHSVRGGLLWHVTGMLGAAWGMLAAYPDLNADLLVAGVLLHDICKVEEMDVSPLGLADDYSVSGLLLGHISLGVVRIAQAGEAVGCDAESVLMLQHMILSHHSVPEYGSPRAPMFPEAEILSHLDMIDARMYDMRLALSSTQPGGVSQRVRSLENRRLYKRQD